MNNTSTSPIFLTNKKESKKETILSEYGIFTIIYLLWQSSLCLTFKNSYATRRVQNCRNDDDVIICCTIMYFVDVELHLHYTPIDGGAYIMVNAHTIQTCP